MDTMAESEGLSERILKESPADWHSDSILDISGRWFCACTKPASDRKEESRLASELSAKGIAVFLPLVQYKIYRDQKRIICRKPLFPGYLFFADNADGEHRYIALKTARCLTIINIVQQERTKQELDAVQKALIVDPALDIHLGIRIGAACRVKSGRLLGTMGWLESFGKRDRLVLRVEVLGQSVALDIDRSDVEII